MDSRSLVPIARDLYHTLVPRSLRNSPVIIILKHYFFDLVKKNKDRSSWHNAIYSKQYYDNVEKNAKNSAPRITSSIIATWAPLSIIDVGCGTGALLDEFRNRGVDVYGLEYAEAAVDICLQRSLPVRKFDIESEHVGDARFGVALSMEVAEHLAPEFSDRYVDLLTALSDRIVITAAPPGQGGTDHVNEQPREYWITKFAQRGYRYDPELTSSWSEEWRSSGTVTWWYYQNLMVFQRQV